MRCRCTRAALNCGTSASTVAPADVQAGRGLDATGLAAEASDLAAGLRLAGSLLGETGLRRVVLVSDG